MRRWLVIPSIALHVGIVITALFLGAWHLDKLDAAKQRLTINLTPVPPPAEAAGSPAKQKPFQQKAHKEIPKVIVTPPDHRDPDVVPAVTNTSEIGTGSGTGSGSGSGTGSGTGPGDSEGPCTADCGPPVVVQKEEKKIIPPNAMKNLFLDGERQLEPPDMTKNELHREGKTQLTASFQVCLDAMGNVASTHQLKSSGYTAYDSVLVQGISKWHYRPYTLDGRGIPVCSVVTFVYAMK